jgi:hypothetical protein
MTPFLVRIGKDDEVVGTDAKPVGFGGVSGEACAEHENRETNSPDFWHLRMAFWCRC